LTAPLASFPMDPVENVIPYSGTVTVCFCFMTVCFFLGKL
jgi:hypothetical protein